jgi:hypothetical protein
MSSNNDVSSGLSTLHARDGYIQCTTDEEANLSSPSKHVGSGTLP